MRHYGYRQELAQVVHEAASKGQYPLNAYMELTVTGGSDVLLSPGYSGSLQAGGSGGCHQKGQSQR